MASQTVADDDLATPLRCQVEPTAENAFVWILTLKAGGATLAVEQEGVTARTCELRLEELSACVICAGAPGYRIRLATGPCAELGGAAKADLLYLSGPVTPDPEAPDAGARLVPFGQMQFEDRPRSWQAGLCRFDPPASVDALFSTLVPGLAFEPRENNYFTAP